MFRGTTLSALNSAIVPVSVTVASNGDVYFVDAPSHSVLKLAPQGQVSIIAGNGIKGFSGDGGPGVMASLAAPIGLALDKAGNLFIADSDNHRIRRVTPNGVISTFAGTGVGGFGGDGGVATAAKLAFPSGVAVDSGGTLFIADEGNIRIRKINNTGIISTIAGNGVQATTGDGAMATAATFIFPQDIAIDLQGNIIVADAAGGVIRRIDAAGLISTVAGNQQFGFSGDNGPAVKATLAQPRGVSADADGNIYFVDSAGSRVRRIDQKGVITTVAGNGFPVYSGDGGKATTAAVANPLATAVDSIGQIYIADTDNRRIRFVNNVSTITTVAGNGQTAALEDGGPARNASLSSPGQIATDGKGNVFICDTGNHRIRQIKPGGVIVTLAGSGNNGFGGDGGPSVAAALSYPWGVAVDASANVYIADRGNHRIRRVDSAGLITTVAGNGSGGFSGDGGAALSAMLAYPSGVAVDSAGVIYISDTGNARIRRVSSTGIIATVAGMSRSGFSGDGGPGTSATLNNPTGLALNLLGDLYIADTGNNSVRLLNRSGVITTIAGMGNSLPSFSGDGGPARSAAFAGPSALDIDAVGNLFIADQRNSRIRRVDNSGIVTTIAGTGESGLSGDGGIATRAELEIPGGVALDSAGNLYISDRDNNRIRVVLATAPSFSVTPNTVSFTASAGGTAPPAQSIVLSPLVSNPSLNGTGLEFEATTSDSWLKINPSRGTMPTNIDITIDPSKLTPGTLTGTITITAPLSLPAVQNVTVRLAVSNTQPAKLALGAQSLTFGLIQSGTASSQNVAVINQGNGTLPFSAVGSTESGGAWLRVSPPSGIATPSAPASVNVSANPGLLAPGTYSGVVRIVGSGTEQQIPVIMSITAAHRAILLSQTGLSFVAVAGGGNPLSQNLGILNTGEGSMAWTLQSSTVSGGNWLSESKSSGTVATPFTDISPVDISANIGGLSAGNYFGQLEVRAPGADNSPQYVSISLTILPTGSNVGPEVNPSGLLFTGVEGITPGSQSVFIANLSNEAIGYASGRLTTDGKPWLTHAPVSSTILPNQPGRIVVQPDFTLLSPGVYRGAITLQLQRDGALRTVNVLSVVAPASTSTSIKSGMKDAGGCSVKRVLMQLTGSQSYINATAGKPTNLEVKVVDDCATPMTETAGGKVMVSYNNGDQGGALVHTSGGSWMKTYQPRTGGKVVVATITAFFPLPNGNILGDQLDMNINVATGESVVPLISRDGVVNGASYIGSSPLAPGSLVSIFGQQLGASNGGPATTSPLPTKLNGAQVWLGDQPLPLLYSDNSQINAQIPYDLTPNTQHQMRIQRGDVISVPEPFTVAVAQPAIFSQNQQGTGQGAVTNGVTGELADVGHPVKAGDVISIYCTGLGPVNPSVSVGTRTPLSPLARTANTVQVLIDNQVAPVQFAGLAPGFTGLYQVNAFVPDGTATGPSVSVVLRVAEQTSAPVSIAIR